MVKAVEIIVQETTERDEVKKTSYEMFHEVIRERFGEYPSETEIRSWYDAIEIPEKTGSCYELKAPHSALMVPGESAVIPTGIEAEVEMIVESIDGIELKKSVLKGHIVLKMTNVNKRDAVDIAAGDVIARVRVK